MSSPEAQDPAPEDGQSPPLRERLRPLRERIATRKATGLQADKDFSTISAMAPDRILPLRTGAAEARQASRITTETVRE
jgi:hypothetical protein